MPVSSVLFKSIYVQYFMLETGIDMKTLYRILKPLLVLSVLFTHLMLTLWVPLKTLQSKEGVYKIVLLCFIWYRTNSNVSGTCQIKQYCPPGGGLSQLTNCKMFKLKHTKFHNLTSIMPEWLLTKKNY